jgi:hypothetical protein
MNTVFDIGQKQNSPEKEAAIAGVPEKFYVDDWELNAVNRKAVESAIDNIALEFSWSKKAHEYLNGINGIDTVNLLKMKMDESWILNEVDQVWLLIDRYKPKRTVRTSTNKQKGSGFKHGIFPDPQNPKRPSEVLITSDEMLLKFGQEFYFQTPITPESQPVALGMGKKSSTKRRSWVYLRFRLKLIKGDKVFYSKPKGIIDMGVQVSFDFGEPKRILSYKLE